MNVSVVINTYNRAPSLRKTLEALRYQTYESFEVVVVNGPSTDGTEEVLSAFSEHIRVARCPDRHLSKSRNLGVDLSSGEIVAFIDDDAIAEPSWIQELVQAYDAERVGGVGGTVYDPTGFRLQYRYSLCDREGQTSFDVDTPQARYVEPKADPFMYLQGTNMSFLRRCLAEVDGFNEEFEYGYEDVEMSMRVIDSGFELKTLAGAPVHHKYFASGIRDRGGFFFDPFAPIKNRFWFALQNGRSKKPEDEILKRLHEVAETIRREGRSRRDSGILTREQYEHYSKRVDEAVEIGTFRGRSCKRPPRKIRAALASEFRHFRTLRAKERRLTICFISSEMPPNDFGGIGRYTADLAAECADLGHDIHVVTASSGQSQIDFERGVWLHRLSRVRPEIPALDHVAVRDHLLLALSAYNEVRRISARTTVDLVVAPLWNCEGLICSLDHPFPTVLTLMTPMAVISTFHPSWKDSDRTQQIIGLERLTFASADYVHAISQDILGTAERMLGASKAQTFVAPLGVRDRRSEFPRRRPVQETRSLRVLFVGRLERRKGVDVLLKAAANLLQAFPQLEFVLVGKETPNTELSVSYRASFERRFGQRLSITSRVTFTGWVSDKDLMQHYADADICCFPSRYESFGLVLLEAMMFGRPIVTTAVGGTREIVEDGGNGLLVEPDDEVALAAALRRLIEDEALRARFGIRSRELFESKFSAPMFAENSLKIYQSIVDMHAARPSSNSDGGESPAKDLESRLARVVAEITGMPPAVARTVSQEMLNGKTELAAVTVSSLWHASDEAFVRGLYALILGREADVAGVRGFVRWLRLGVPRIVVVKLFLDSSEAQALGVGTSLLWEFAMQMKLVKGVASCQRFASAAWHSALGLARRGLR
jgi:glycogen(starch) synthase